MILRAAILHRETSRGRASEVYAPTPHPRAKAIGHTDAHRSTPRERAARAPERSTLGHIGTHPLAVALARAYCTRVFHFNTLSYAVIVFEKEICPSTRPRKRVIIPRMPPQI